MNYWQKEGINEKKNIALSRWDDRCALVEQIWIWKHEPIYKNNHKFSSKRKENQNNGLEEKKVCRKTEGRENYKRRDRKGNKDRIHWYIFWETYAEIFMVKDKTKEILDNVLFESRTKKLMFW